LADVYDALSSKRPYKSSLPDHQVLNILQAEIGRHFDPAVFQAFTEGLMEIHKIRTELPD
jgi:putative two-component system response regulator